MSGFQAVIVSQEDGTSSSEEEPDRAGPSILARKKAAEFKRQAQKKEKMDKKLKLVQDLRETMNKPDPKESSIKREPGESDTEEVFRILLEDSDDADDPERRDSDDVASEDSEASSDDSEPENVKRARKNIRKVERKEEIRRLKARLARPTSPVKQEVEEEPKNKKKLTSGQVKKQEALDAKTKKLMAGAKAQWDKFLVSLIT